MTNLILAVDAQSPCFVQHTESMRTNEEGFTLILLYLQPNTIHTTVLTYPQQNTIKQKLRTH